MTLSHTRDGSGRLTRKSGQKLGPSSSAQQSTFNLASMKRSISGTNYNSLLRPLLQPSSSTGLEDRPPPPPLAPTQLQHQQQNRGGLFARSNPTSNVFGSSFVDSESISNPFDVKERQRGEGVDNLINNCRSDERKQNLTQSSAHKNISNNVITSTSLQQRLHQIQQSSELATKPDVLMTVSKVLIIELPRTLYIVTYDSSILE